MAADRTEAHYDTVIAPLLKEVARLCHDVGMPFVACVEYELNAVGMTFDHGDIDECGPQFRLARYGVSSRGNIDRLIDSLRKDDEAHIPAGGETQSCYMHMLAKATGSAA